MNSARETANLSLADAFAALARRRLGAPEEGGNPPSDYDLNPGMVPDPAALLTAAAVLVPVVAHAQPTLLLTQRTETLARHAGQIAFPGGRIDPGDRDPQAAALREAHDEIGLSSDFITPLGFLDTYRTGTGFAIHPLVAIIQPSFTLRLQESEVADAFEVPLAFLMNKANYETQTRIWQGTERRFFAIPYENRYIWGATAGILRNMQERLYGP